LIFIMIKNTAYTDLFMFVIGPVAVIYFLIELFRLRHKEEQKKLLAALILIIFSIIFFAIFEQAGGSLALFANGNLHDKLLFFRIDPSIINNSSNSLFVIILSPLLGLIWLAMAKRKIEPNTIVKFGLAFLLLGVGYYVFYYTKFFADAQGKTSLNIFTLAYLFVTIGELCLSPIGLSMITKLSPKHLAGMMMGLWFLASAYGQYVAGRIGAYIAEPKDNDSLSTKLMAYTDGYYLLAICAIICGILIIAIYPLIKRLMLEVK